MVYFSKVFPSAPPDSKNWFFKRKNQKYTPLKKKSFCSERAMKNIFFAPSLPKIFSATNLIGRNKHNTQFVQFLHFDDDEISLPPGNFVFTPFATYLADRYGRRMTFLLSLWLTVVFSVGCAFSPSFVCFLVFRFLSGASCAVKKFYKFSKRFQTHFTSIM